MSPLSRSALPRKALSRTPFSETPKTTPAEKIESFLGSTQVNVKNQSVDPRTCSIICFTKQSGHTGSGTTCHDPSSNFIFITSLLVKPAPHFAHFLLFIRSLLLPTRGYIKIEDVKTLLHKKHAHVCMWLCENLAGARLCRTLLLDSPDIACYF